MLYVTDVGGSLKVRVKAVTLDPYRLPSCLIKLFTPSITLRSTPNAI